jgi:hypothetical protein
MSLWPKHLLFVAASGGALFWTSFDAAGKWMKWAKIDPFVFPVNIFGIPDTTVPPIPVSPATHTSVFCGPSSQSSDGIELYFVGGDGHLYGHLDWRQWDGSAWRKVEISGFAVRPGGDGQVTADRLFMLSTTGELWSAQANRSVLELSPVWEMVSFPGLSIRRFSVAIDAGATHVVATASDGSVWVALAPITEPASWTPLGRPGGSPVPEHASVAWAIPYAGRLDVFAVASNGFLYTATRERTSWSGWHQPIEGGQGFAAAARGPVIVQRVNRQVEVFVQSRDGDLARTWWS